MGQTKNSLVGWAVIPLLLAIVFYFPRFLSSSLGPENPWTSFFFLYGFGLIYLGSGLVLVTKTKACNLQRPRDRFWFNGILLGFCFFAGLHALWIYLSLSIPYLGGQ